MNRLNTLASGAMQNWLDQAEINAILNEARRKLAKAGLRTAVSSGALPGSGISAALLIAASDRDLHGELVAISDGRGNAYCDIKSFSEKVDFSVSENRLEAHEASAKPGNHGAKWSPENDEELMVMWSYNSIEGTLAKIAEKLQRSEVSIVARLVKTGFVESREEARDISRRRAGLSESSSAN